MSNRRIFIIEDDVAIGLAMQAHLLFDGHEVTLHRDGRSGLQAALADPPDVIFLDLMMPELDGFGALRALADGGLVARTWVVSALTDARSAGQVESYGVAGFIRKPFRNEMLTEAVEQTPSVLSDAI